MKKHMKKHMKKLTMFLLAALMVLGSIMPAASAAQTKASTYFKSPTIGISAQGSGKVKVSFTIRANQTMDTLGASYITIWEKQSSGAYKQVKIFTRADGIMSSNTASASGSVTYSGTAGTKYYAIINFYTTLGDDSEAEAYQTSTVTAS